MLRMSEPKPIPPPVGIAKTPRFKHPQHDFTHRPVAGCTSAAGRYDPAHGTHRSGCFPSPMIGLALKMLFGDTAKYLMLVAGLFFATFLIVQQARSSAG
jgi:hypothetical protein